MPQPELFLKQKQNLGIYFEQI